MPLVAVCMAFEGALSGLQQFRYLATTTLAITSLCSAGLLGLSRMRSFSIFTIWGVIVSLFCLRTTSSAYRIWRVLRPQEGTAASTFTETDSDCGGPLRDQELMLVKEKAEAEDSDSRPQ